MPRFDGTGPMGRGPLTGRGMGFCAVPLSEITPRGYIPTPYRPTSVYGYGVPYPSMPRFFFRVGRGRRVFGGRGRGYGSGRGRGRW
ncbi:MAG: DUF5320 domain-containing protein [Theionarchaea archaeon]|nr:MAG: hypothetical protein AYK18_06485 [Theionarchaea archaeon DG-70]MBU7012499.1 DUF5320 domain-containing protein [Theionarchaea archaeon]